MVGPLILLGILLTFLVVGVTQLTRRMRSLQQAMEQRIPELIRAERRNLFNQFEAYLYLKDRLGLHQGLPYTTDWSAAPDFLKLIVDRALAQKPEVIVECSSGLTTLMLASCCELNGKGRVFSLENGAEFAEQTRKQLKRYGLESYAQVVDAPLQPLKLAEREFEWYAPLESLPERIELLVIDGPPGFLQSHSRYPALPQLMERLADGALIYLDDAARADEQELVAKWLADYPQLEHEYIKTERGCSLLRLRRD